MAQNIYDDPDFFAGYSALPRSVTGLAGAPEWPALRALLPELSGRRVVDLGCGFGWFSRWAREQGAASVLGLDLSANMLARAMTDTDDAAITYERQDLDALTLPLAAFDLAFSSLVLHYLAHLDRFLSTVHDALVPGAPFVFSCEHPLFTAPSSQTFVVDREGHVTWPLDRYLDEGPRTTEWIAPGVVKQHRTIGTYISLLVRAGFVIDELVEWGPSPEQIAEHPDWAPARERPMFMLVATHRSR